MKNKEIKQKLRQETEVAAPELMPGIIAEIERGKPLADIEVNPRGARSGFRYTWVGLAATFVAVVAVSGYGYSYFSNQPVEPADEALATGELVEVIEPESGTLVNEIIYEQSIVQEPESTTAVVGTLVSEIIYEPSVTQEEDIYAPSIAQETDGGIISPDLPEIRPPATSPPEQSVAAPQNSQMIDISTAKSIALEYTGVDPAAAYDWDIELSTQGGKTVYEIEFEVGRNDYDLIIDAVTGEVLFSKTDKQAAAPETPNTIPEADAKAIALDFAGVTEAEITKYEAKLDWEDGVLVYEIEFERGRDDYEFVINAATGEILEYDIDYDD